MLTGGEIAGSETAGREMGLALIKYADAHNADLRRGGDLAFKHWSVVTGSKKLDDDPIVIQAFQHANAMIKAASLFGTNDDTVEVLQV